MAVAVSGLGSPDRYALRVIEASLNGFTGRLVSEIRERRGLAYSTSATAALLSDAGLFRVEASTEPGSADAVLGLLEAELARLRDEPISEVGLNRATGLAAGSWVVQLETARLRAVDLAARWSLGVTEPLEEEQARLVAVTAADVQRVARQYLDPDRALVVVLRPE